MSEVVKTQAGHVVWVSADSYRVPIIRGFARADAMKMTSAFAFSEQFLYYYVIWPHYYGIWNAKPGILSFQEDKLYSIEFQVVRIQRKSE